MQGTGQQMAAAKWGVALNAVMMLVARVIIVFGFMFVHRRAGAPMFDSANGGDRRRAHRSSAESSGPRRKTEAFDRCIRRAPQNHASAKLELSTRAGFP
jgi:hypothetical protein